QTRKLFKVCVMRHIPIFTFINKMDREAMDTFELLDDIEKELGIATCPVNWPIGSGKAFRGVYDRNEEEIELFFDTKKGTTTGEVKKIRLDDPDVDSYMDPDQKEQLLGEIERSEERRVGKESGSRSGAEEEKEEERMKREETQ